MRTLSHGLHPASPHRLVLALLRASQGEESLEMG